MTTNVIHRYTRKQAIEDGFLIDVSKLAKEAGFSFPIAVTSGAWAACVQVPESVSGWQDETGRLWDILNLLRLRAKNEASHYLQFRVRDQNEPKGPPETVTLVAHCGPGDSAEPVLTIMLPEDV